MVTKQYCSYHNPLCSDRRKKVLILVHGTFLKCVKKSNLSLVLKLLQNSNTTKIGDWKELVR